MQRLMSYLQAVAPTPQVDMLAQMCPTKVIQDKSDPSSAVLLSASSPYGIPISSSSSSSFFLDLQRLQLASFLHWYINSCSLRCFTGADAARKKTKRAGQGVNDTHLEVCRAVARCVTLKVHLASTRCCSLTSLPFTPSAVFFKGKTGSFVDPEPDGLGYSICVRFTCNLCRLGRKWVINWWVKCLWGQGLASWQQQNATEMEKELKGKKHDELLSDVSKIAFVFGKLEFDFTKRNQHVLIIPSAHCYIKFLLPFFPAWTSISCPLVFWNLHIQTQMVLLVRDFIWVSLELYINMPVRFSVVWAPGSMSTLFAFLTSREKSFFSFIS